MKDVGDQGVVILDEVVLGPGGWFLVFVLTVEHVGGNLSWWNCSSIFRAKLHIRPK